MLLPKQEHIKDKKHLKWLASLPCVLTGAVNVQSAHIREGNNSGMGRKPSDNQAIPLSVEKHREQHTMKESAFYELHGKTLDQVKELARNLYKISGMTREAHWMIAEFRNR